MRIGMWLAAPALMLGTAQELAAQKPAAAPPAPLRAAMMKEAGGELREFYRTRGWRPIWIRGNAMRPEAKRLASMFDSADLDGLKPRSYRIDALDKVRGGDPRTLAEAEMALTGVWLRYAMDMRRAPDSGMVLADRAAAPRAPDKAELLAQLATAPMLDGWLKSAGWMHPIYGQMRTMLAGMKPGSREAELLQLNLQRARSLPADGKGRHVVVDAAGQRLMMYDKGKLAGTMKVVVGRADNPTPMMASVIRYVVLNPYWNVPPDLVGERVAPHVVSGGVGYLKAKRYQVLSDWSAQAAVTDPKLVDWKAVAAGGRPIRVRQLPGPENGMGKMKFMFPNDQGIYLHDTPDKGLFTSGTRNASAGCVRLENAQVLARWMFGKPLAAKASAVEQRVDAPRPVPVYLTYFTAYSDGKKVTVRADSYGRDKERRKKKRRSGSI